MTRFGKSPTIDIGQAINSAISKATSEVAKDMRKWVKAANSDTRKLDKRMSEANRKVVSQARANMVNHYKQQRRFGGVAAYRDSGKGKDSRASGGRMLEAIRSESMITARGSEIMMFDFAGLKRQAPHWYRLNFGSGQKPKSSAKLTGEIRLNVAGKRHFISRGITFNGWRAGEANFLPKGFFAGLKFPSSGEAHRGLDRHTGRMRKGKAFYLGVPKRKNISKVSYYNSLDMLPTRSTRAYGFLEVGVKTVNQEFAKETSAVLREMKKDFEKGKTKTIKAK